MDKTTQTLNVEGMSCQNCIGHVEEALSAVEGVQKASANLDQNQVTVDFAPKMTDLKALKAAIRGAGFEVTGVVGQSGG